MAEANNKNQPMNQIVNVKYRLGQRPMAGLAFYDFDPETFDLKSAFYWILEFMIQHKMQGHLMGSGHHKKRVLFRNGLKTIEKKGFECVGHINVDAVQEGSGLDSWDHGYDFSFCISNDDDPLNFFCFDLELFPFSIKFYEYFILNHAKFCDFKYAFYYEREFMHGPDYYGMGGTCNGGKSKEDNNQIGNWSRHYGNHFRRPNQRFDYYTGLLRDIYPINILIQDHLNQRVGKGTLEDWIKAADHRGTLHKLTEKHTSWRVPHEDIDSVRQALIPWRLLVSFNDFDCTPRTMTQEQIDTLIAEGK